MGWFSTSTLIGRFMAPVVGGIIIGAMALNPDIGYKIVYLVCGAAGILVLFLALKIPNPDGEIKNNQKWEETLKTLRTVISNKGILLTSAVEAAILFAYGTFETFLPLYSLKIGLSAYEIGIFLSAQVITLAFTKPVMGRFSDKHERKPQIFAGAIIGAVCIGSFRFLHPLYRCFSKHPIWPCPIHRNLSNLCINCRPEQERDAWLSHGYTRLSNGHWPYHRAFSLRIHCRLL